MLAIDVQPTYRKFDFTFDERPFSLPACLPGGVSHHGRHDRRENVMPKKTRSHELLTIQHDTKTDHRSELSSSCHMRASRSHSGLQPILVEPSGSACRSRRVCTRSGSRGRDREDEETRATGTAGACRRRDVDLGRGSSTLRLCSCDAIKAIWTNGQTDKPQIRYVKVALDERLTVRLAPEASRGAHV